MAAVSMLEPLQVVNEGLGVERQKLLRERMAEYFAAFTKKTRQKRELQYILNRENYALDQVLRLNDGADALFTAFNYDARTHQTDTKDQIAGEEVDVTPVAPHLRFTLITDLQRLCDLGYFRHRKLIMVGDIYTKLGQFLRSSLPVQLTFFTDEARTQVSDLLTIHTGQRLAPADQDPGVPPSAEGDGPIPVSRVNSLRIADIPFDGIINMPERGNRYILPDASLLDTSRKLFVMRGSKEGASQERLETERRAFVRTKRVLVVLEPDLEHIVSDRMKFDGMKNLWRAHSLEEARALLANGRTQGFIEYFESHGYDLLLELCSPEQRDRLLVALLGEKLGEQMQRELRAAKTNLSALEGADVEALLGGVPAPLVDLVLEGLQRKSYDRVLALIPVKIRDTVILDYLRRAENVHAAWRAIGEEERKDALQTLTPLLLAHLFLKDTSQFQRRLAGLKLDFAETVNSTSYAALPPEEQADVFSQVARAAAKARPPAAALGHAFQPAELERLMEELLLLHGQEAYNRLNPVVRKQLWLTVGQQAPERIFQGLPLADKLEVLKGLKDSALAGLLDAPGYLDFLRAPENAAYAGTVYLALKKVSPGESKTALLKRLFTVGEYRPRRAQVVPPWLLAPEQAEVLARLTEKVDALDFRFDCMICMRAHLEALRDQPALAGATVVLVDALIDPSLMRSFEQAAISKEEFTKTAATVDEQIKAMRAKLAQRETQDPAGAYLLETMLVLNDMSQRVAGGQLPAAALQQLDSRQEARNRLLAGLREEVESGDSTLEKGRQQALELQERVQSGQQAQEAQVLEARGLQDKAKALLEECDRLKRGQAQAEEGKSRVALTQKELSLQFFHIIQPLILANLRGWSPFSALLRLLGVGRLAADQTRRLIFLFTDREIEQILRHRIVFCTQDSLLVQFILTCLRIDRLEGDLFTLATPETLPEKGIDLLFYGPGYMAEDFTDRVKRKRIVQFADDAFMERLTANEQLKARIKQALTEGERALQQKRPLLEQAVIQAQAARDKVRTAAQGLAQAREEHRALRERMQTLGERVHAAKGDLDLLEATLDTVDERFKSLRLRLGETYSGAADSEEAVQARTQLMQDLQEELTSLNRELARLMMIKGFKDAGQHVSRSSQERVLRNMELRERIPPSRPLRKVTVADDGSVPAQAIHRAFAQAAQAHLKLDESQLESLSLKRLLSRLEGEQPVAYDLVVIISDQPADAYEELRTLVRRLRQRVPKAYPLVFVPFKEMEDLPEGDPERQAIVALQERCTLVNTGIVDYSLPRAMLRLLQRKAPRA